ncbi:MAG: FHA domain-containing protein, partial [Deltaproteobacteria bacterium]|nr:FHA domain-containing protein [Deltaproteobacteria bacterium]
MPMDPHRKTLRHFYCSDELWQVFEQMSETMDRGVDELVNDAMRTYAERGGYLAGLDTDAQPSGLYSPDSARPPGVPPPLPAARMTAHYAGRPPTPAAPPVAVPPPIPDGGDAPPLYLIFGSQKYLVDKDQFIIGRGAKTSDLPIRDGNISRKHAAVVRRAGAYYIKDLGSTNGIDFNGERIEARKIE